MGLLLDPVLCLTSRVLGLQGSIFMPSWRLPAEGSIKDRYGTLSIVLGLVMGASHYP